MGVDVQTEGFVTTTRRKTKPTMVGSTATTAPASTGRVRGDDDYPLEHWRRVARAAFPPDWSEEQQRTNAAFVAGQIAKTRGWREDEGR